MGSPKVVGDARALVVINNTETAKAPGWANHLESLHVVIPCCRKSDLHTTLKSSIVFAKLAAKNFNSNGSCRSRADDCIAYSCSTPTGAQHPTAGAVLSP